MRVLYADVSPIVIPGGMTDEQALFLGDIFPTGWMAAANCEIEPTDIVAIWGCGPVGQFCIKSALLQGAARVIAIDNVPERQISRSPAIPISQPRQHRRDLRF